MSEESYFGAIELANKSVRPNYVAVYRPDGDETAPDSDLVLCHYSPARSRKLYLRPRDEVVSPQDKIHSGPWTPLLFKSAKRAKMWVSAVVGWQLWSPSI